MRTLVAGLGNVFEGDDGFGVAVAARLADEHWPEGAETRDYGIRGVHLAYQLLDGYDLVVIADAVTRGGQPGTLYVIDHATDDDLEPPGQDSPMFDAHDLTPDAVLALVPLLVGTLGRVVVIGCEPQTIAPRMGLSAAVEGNVERAAQLVIDIVREAHATGARMPSQPLTGLG
jgi:hydrogenase maturation protease